MITADEIYVKLLSDVRWLERGIVAIYECQTKDEQAAEDTLVNNGVGFNSVDAYILSSFARQILAGRNLSQKQRLIAVKKMPKYAGQLHRLALQKAAS